MQNHDQTIARTRGIRHTRLEDWNAIYILHIAVNSEDCGGETLHGWRVESARLKVAQNVLEDSLKSREIDALSA